MNLLRKALISLAGVAVIVLVVSIAVPRAVHAVVATFVQVVNTPTTAMPTVAAPAKSKLVRELCEASYNSGPSAGCSFSAVPMGQTLFVESVTIYSQSSTGADPTQARIGGNFETAYIPMIRQASVSGEDFLIGAMAGRISFEEGETPSCAVFLSANSDAGFTCSLFGYTAPST
jgi:hypothetical protein